MKFENTIIKKYWPAEDKNADGDIIPQLHIQCEAELDNSRQVGHLFTSMVKGLVQVTFTHEETGEAVTLPAATVKPFNVKQKKIRIGKGEDAAVVLTEYAHMTIVTRLDEEGELMKALYPLFNRQVIMDVEDYRSEPAITTEPVARPAADAEPSEPSPSVGDETATPSSEDSPF
ncbi:MAG: hypothetical protein Q9P90_02305 [candidate division KSB1 bacterium]|nr:hypothetical protein [candidate division KSB1 bacterium]